ncbi:MAG: hypothetical protein QXF52_04835 [Thermoproteota archaeon]
MLKMGKQLQTGILNRLKTWFKHIPLALGLMVFYSYGFIWTLKPRRIKTMRDVFELFYIRFLRLERKHVEILELNDSELVTVSRNPCPILRLTLMLGMDTRYTCRLVSETVCRYVLKRMDPRLVFERDYGRIRPYWNGCLERIYLKKTY